MKRNKHKIRQFVIQQIGAHPRDITKLVSKTFRMSRQAANRYLQQMVDEGLIIAEGNTKSREYSLVVLGEQALSLNIAPDLAEDQVWRESVRPLLKDIPQNILTICQYSFTEMLNNVVDHSEGTQAYIHIRCTAISIDITIIDDGVGIFHKIKREFHLDDERHAILELAKGKLTTAPSRHSGEGIFFTSRVCDHFSILSGKLYFGHAHEGQDWLLEEEDTSMADGTLVNMSINPTSNRTLQEVFEQYASEDEDFGFNKTHVPVFLARYGDENLISRSQAKRLLARFEKFKEVMLDFENVAMIGQAFADEIFRVFQQQNPDVNITWINAKEEVEKMIRRITKRENNQPSNVSQLSLFDNDTFSD